MISNGQSMMLRVCVNVNRYVVCKFSNNMMCFFGSSVFIFSNGMCNHIHIESSSIHVLINHCRFAIIDVHNSQFTVFEF